MFASLGGQTEIVKELISKGANVNDKDNSGNSALNIAKKNKEKEIINILKKAGAKE